MVYYFLKPCEERSLLFRTGLWKITHPGGTFIGMRIQGQQYYQEWKCKRADFCPASFLIQITYHCLPLCAMFPSCLLPSECFAKPSYVALSQLSQCSVYFQVHTSYTSNTAHISQLLSIHDGCYREELRCSPSSSAVDPSGRADPIHQLALRWHHRRPTLQPHIRRGWLRKWQPLPGLLSKSNLLSHTARNNLPQAGSCGQPNNDQHYRM